MTSKTDRFPYGTKSSCPTGADYAAVCETCGWKAAVEPGLPLFPQEAGK